MKIALVGGAGFIGLALAARLKELSIDPVVLDTERRLARATNLLRGIKTTPYPEGAFRNASIRDADALVHLAWSSQPANSMSGMTEDAQSNIVGSLALFSFAAEAGIKKIVFASSGGTVYGNTDRLPISEDWPPNPVSAYGVSKLAVERYLQLVAFHHGLTGISLRIGNPYGSYQLAGTPIGVIANFIKLISGGAPLKIYGDGEIVRDYIWIDDVADAVSRAACCEVASGEYNIGSGKGYSINQIADLVEREMSCGSDRTYLEHRSFDAQQVILDYGKFESATGWRPTVALQQGVGRMVKAWREAL